jgi:hypothetical protein
VLAAAVQAGEEVARQGRVSQQTLEALTRDLAPRETVIAMANEYFAQELAKA